MTEPGATADHTPDPRVLPHRDRSRAYFARRAADLDIAPFDLVQFMINAVPDFVALHAAVRLDVFELLADREGMTGMTSDELAFACECDPSSMRRLLRWLHAYEFVATCQGRYQLTDLGHVLTTAATRSQRHAVLVTGSSYWWEAAGNLVEAIRRGHPAPADGLPLYEHLAEHPALAEEFDQFMIARSSAVGQDLAAIDDFAQVTTIADLGGGQGGVLAAILNAHPGGLHGVLAERADVAARAQRYLAEQGVADRVTIMPGDLFDAIPQGAQRYLLSSVLHNHSNTDCIDLLTRVRDAMEDAGEATELWIVEGMLPRAAGAPSRWYSIDIRMATLFRGGRVRSDEDFRHLAQQAGLHIRKSMALASGQTLLIAQLDTPTPTAEQALCGACRSTTDSQQSVHLAPKGGAA